MFYFTHNCDKSQGGGGLRYDCSMQSSYMSHSGTDFAASFGDLIYPGATGRVIFTYRTCTVPASLASARPMTSGVAVVWATM